MTHHTQSETEREMKSHLRIGILAIVRGNDLKMKSSFPSGDTDRPRTQATPTPSSPDTRRVADLKILVHVTVGGGADGALQAHVTAVLTRTRHTRSVRVHLPTPVKLSPSGRCSFSSPTTTPRFSPHAPSVGREDSETP